VPETPPPAEPKPFAFTPNAAHLVRTALQANLTLGQMADQKASILMGATFVVFTLSVGQASRGPVPHALLVLGAAALVSALLAILALMPSVGVPEGEVGDGDNLLFFGVYARLSEEEFAARVIPLLDSDETIYRAMLRDMHQNGRVLARKKYRLLGYAYRAFLAGLILTVVVFVAERLAG
jgi:hypothetical protein